ncbi:MAG: hypothetical protein J5786_04680 [Clostridiales bacterium]|nr:hypothetical protein [Clostridiales bacterium]
MKKIIAFLMLGTLLLTTSCSENKEVIPGKYVTEADDTSIEITEDGKVSFNGFDWSVDQEFAELLTCQHLIDSGEIEDTEEARKKVCDAIDVAAQMDGKANTYNKVENDEGIVSIYIEIPNSRSNVGFEYIPSDKSLKYSKLIKADPKTFSNEDIIYTLSK